MSLTDRPALVSLSESRALAAAIAREAGLPLLPVEERNFESGEFKLRPLESVRGRGMLVLQTLASTDGAPVTFRLMRLLFLLQVLRDAGADPSVALLPYYAFARKDRRTQVRDPVTARYVAELLEATRAGCVIGLDVHNQAAFDNAFRIPTIHLSAVPLLADHVVRNLMTPGTELTVVSPDVGGIKRAQLLREQIEAQAGRDIEIAFIEKRRVHDVISGGSLAGDVSGRTVILIDDLCASGGTLIRAAEACRSRGATAVHAAVTHAPLAEGIERLTAAEAIASITVTDSVGIPATPAAPGPGKLVTLSIAPIFGQALQRLASGRPVAPLLERWPVSPQDE
jgi:ribose-phosphate pyrophosphokinase